MGKFAAALAALAAILPNSASARWMEASSAHFVVYADDRESAVREFSEELERFHSALELLTGQQLKAPSPSNRLTIYVVSDQREVGSLYSTVAGDGRFIGGFYLPRAGGSIAVVPRISKAVGDEIDESMETLLHEYTHHFVFSTSAIPLPLWISEGGAEFFGSASFEKDGSVGIGRPAEHRAGELFELAPVSLDELFDEDLHTKKRRTFDSYYGWAWLLYHYLTFAPERQGQFGTYISGLAQGLSSADAAHKAFGDFDQLQRDLYKYRNSRKMTFLDLKPELLSTGAIEIRALSEGAGAMLPVQIRSKVGVTPATAPKVAADAREVAARYHSDPFVLAALAEAEVDVGNEEEAIAAADAALAVDPLRVNAYVQKGYALFALAKDAPDPDAAYAKANEPFIALNKIENDHPLPLIYYFRSYTERGMMAPELAMQALERAVQLAPFDRNSRLWLALEQLLRKQYAAARSNLLPVALDPHGGSSAATAQKVLARLDASESPPTWDEIQAIVNVRPGDEDPAESR